MIEVFKCEQGTEEWRQCRLGIPTASEFSAVMAKGRGGKDDSKTRRTYMLKLIGERLTGEPADNFSNAHTDRGHTMEPEARDLYTFMTDLSPEIVGFIRNGDKGCSPDSLIGDVGMLEIKTKLPHLQLDCLLADRIPPEHYDQCQGQLWVAEREWVDLVVYWPKLPLFAKRVFRDEQHIKKISMAVDVFNTEMLELITKIEQRRAA